MQETAIEPLYGKNPTQLQEICAAEGLPRFAAKQIARHLYVRRATDFGQMTDLALAAIETVTAPWGMAWSPTRITVSTAGVARDLPRLLDETKVHIAVSLHNPFHDQRAEIMPIENAYPIREVADVLRRHDFTGQRRVSFEYILMEGLNDSPAHIKELCRLLDGIKCRINLIRFHKIPDSPYFSPSEDRMRAFRDTLTARGIQTTIRASRGEDIQAACGLLSTVEKRRADTAL